MIDAQKYTDLIALVQKTSAVKETVFRAAYIKVEWPSGAKYYASTAYSRTSPFRDVKKYTSAHIEPRLHQGALEDFDINGDIRSSNINVTFDDTDGEIKELFRTHKAVRCSIYLYWPQVDLNVEVWWGQLLPPQIEGRYSQQCVIRNGYRDPNWMIPNRPVTEECPYAPRFGGRLDTLDKIATNGCPYDKHLGGSRGNLDPATNRPYKACPGSRNACIARLGNNGKYFGGASLTASSTQSDSHPGNMTFTKGGSKVRLQPTKWIAGTKKFTGSDVMMWTRRPNQNHPDEAFVTIIARVGEGPVQGIANLKVNDKSQQLERDWAFRLGERGQSTLAGGYPGMSVNETFSGTACFLVTYGWVDPNVTGDSLQTSIDVVGYNLVAVFTDATTFTRKWTDDRVWWLMEMYTNQKCGLGYEHNRFWIASTQTGYDEALETSAWSRKGVTFSFVNKDGESESFPHRRTTFDAALEGKPAVTQIADVCRSGRIFPPFQYDGRYSIVAQRVFTTSELNNAITFYDSGPNRNIHYSPGELPVEIAPIPDDKLVNEVNLTYDERNNFDIPRTIRISDPDQQAIAAKVEGNDAFHVVPDQYVALGVRNKNEAVKLGYSLLYFGEFESGGIKNNCPVKFYTPFEYTLKLRRYQPFKLSLTTMDIPIGPTGVAQVETVTAAGTASSSGNITVTVTSEYLTASPITVAITNGDTPAQWAAKVRTALQADAAIDEMFEVRIDNSTSIRLVDRTRRANETARNVEISAGSTGITPASSTTTTEGIADTPFEYFRCLGIRKIGALAEVTGIAYNRRVSEAFEISADAPPPPPGQVCSVNADCPPGWVCDNGICIPGEGGPVCNKTPELTYNSSNKTIEMLVPPC